MKILSHNCPHCHTDNPAEAQFCHNCGTRLWKTVICFLLGEQGPQKGIMAGGALNTVLNPTALLSSAIEMPLLGWACQAEITADRSSGTDFSSGLDDMTF